VVGVDADLVSRETELAQIRQFLETKGATRCPTVYVAPTIANLSPAEEARRIAEVKVRQVSKREILVVARRFNMNLRP
jgi:hypothetical protein